MTRRSLRLLSAALVALALTLTLSAQDSGSSKPQAVPVAPVKDFEIVPKGEVLLHSFQIRNEGDAPLEITSVNPTCGCTVVSFDRTIAPGKIGTIRAEVDTADFTGPIAKSISVFTNDTANPKMQLVVKAKVRPYIGIEPGYARYIYVQEENVQPIPQVIWSEDGLPLDIVSVKSPYDHLKVGFRPATEEERNKDVENDAQQYVVDIALEPNAPVGALRDYVLVTFDHPKQKTARIPISGFVRPRSHVTPQTVELGDLEAAVLPLKRTLTFTNFITDGIEVIRIDSTLGGLSGEAKMVEDTGHRFRILLTVDENMPKGDFSGKLSIHTTDPKRPVVEIPVSGAVL